MPRAGGAGGQASRGRRCHSPCTDSFQAKGKHLNSLTFELPGTLFTLAARMAVLQILNTVLRVIWGLPPSPRPAWGWPRARGDPGRPSSRGSLGWLPRHTASRGVVSPSLRMAFCILCWADAPGLSLLIHSPAHSSLNSIFCVRARAMWRRRRAVWGRLTLS